MKTVALAIIVSALTVSLSAQWLTQPTRGIPRTVDGKPNLAAPTPRTPDGKPDFSGLWTRVSRTVSGNLTPVQPWVNDLVRQRREDFGKDSMMSLCLPLGPVYLSSGGGDPNIAGMTKVVQTAGLMVILNSDLTYRQIFMDGRALETDPNPSWMGYSVGIWDGDTLVVESVGFNDRSWLDAFYPHTDALRTTERYRRSDFGHLELEVTMNDPTLYSTPFKATFLLEIAADTELLEYVCNENTGSRQQHWVGKLSDAQQSEVKISAGTLERYVGTYVEQKPFWTGQVARVFEVTFDEGALFAQMKGNRTTAKTRLIAQSETLFASGSGGLILQFVRDTQGVPTHLLDTHVSGDYRFERTK